jgi:Kef-type K+ transport system membrane component KefB
MYTIYYIGIILIAGLLIGKIVSFLKLPEVTGYLIAGVLVGPSVLGLIPLEAASSFSAISEIALGFIAYSIGSEFRFSHVKEMGQEVVLITVFQVFGSVLFVYLSMHFIFNQSASFSIVLAAIASATAPAATIMVIRQYKAKGPLVDTLLPVVALDDAFGIIIFGICITIAKALLNKGTNISIAKIILSPFVEIILAVVIGIGIGVILSIVANKAKGSDQLLNISTAAIFISVGISTRMNISPLLVCMCSGAAVANIIPNSKSKRVSSIVDRFTPPVFVAFFTVAGVELNISLLKSVGMMGIVYILARMFGKILGANLGAKLAHSPTVVQKYLGYTLVPQAGVAIGLALVAETTLPHPYGSQIRTIVLSATVIYELIGPLMTKIAIFKAGEVPTYKKIKSNESNFNC